MLDRLAETIRGELGRFGSQPELAAIVERWRAAVGEAVARNAWPARIGRDGTLHANAADAVWAFELTQRAPEIARRLGVPAVRFSPGALADPTRTDAEPSPPALVPSPGQVRAAARIAAAISDRDLRETVQKAAALSLARGLKTTPSGIL